MPAPEVVTHQRVQSILTKEISRHDRNKSSLGGQFVAAQNTLETHQYEMANLDSMPSTHQADNTTLVKHLKASGIGEFDNQMSLQLYGEKTT